MTQVIRELALFLKDEYISDVRIVTPLATIGVCLEEDGPERSKSTDATVRVCHHTKICIYSDITITRKQASEYNFENWLLVLRNTFVTRLSGGSTTSGGRNAKGLVIFNVSVTDLKAVAEHSDLTGNQIGATGIDTWVCSNNRVTRI
jgi:hypothetical protein